MYSVLICSMPLNSELFLPTFYGQPPTQIQLLCHKSYLDFFSPFSVMANTVKGLLEKTPWRAKLTLCVILLAKHVMFCSLNEFHAHC